jgi:6-pyruvoyltetrahydropterin/6-carboxytetrahydropterin synthase
MSTEVTKIFRFEACHSVKDAYTDRCDRVRGGLHGHSYVVEVTLEGNIKADGMVLDFSLLKEKFNHIIDAFDHSFIVNSEDKVMIKLAPYLSARFIFFPSNPTAENMARYFFEYIANGLPRLNYRVESEKISIKSVVVWETVTGKATCREREYKSIPPLLVSFAISEKWNEEELSMFHSNCGVELPAYPLISNLDLETLEDSSLKIIATTTKNCK